MKRAIAAIGSLALAMLLLAGVAGANSVKSEVNLDGNALFITELDPVTSNISVAADVRCAGTATLKIDVVQPPPPQPATAAGTGKLTVTCRGDGSSQKVAVSIDDTVGVFQPGQAQATATLTAAEAGFLQPDSASQVKIITIRTR